jgi:hypothetical protein
VLGVVRLVIPFVGLPARWVQEGAAVAFSAWLAALLLGGVALADCARSPRPAPRPLAPEEPES